MVTLHQNKKGSCIHTYENTLDTVFSTDVLTCIKFPVRTWRRSLCLVYRLSSSRLGQTPPGRAGSAHYLQGESRSPPATRYIKSRFHWVRRLVRLGKQTGRTSVKRPQGTGTCVSACKWTRDVTVAGHQRKMRPAAHWRGVVGPDGEGGGYWRSRMGRGHVLCVLWGKSKATRL